MKIKAFATRYNMRMGEWPHVLIDADKADSWYGRDPFEGVQADGVSENLVIPRMGTTDGHNVVIDSTFHETLRVDSEVPVSPLFVKDLTGRVIYIGFGPERKGNVEWDIYQPQYGPSGEVLDGDVNPFSPLRMFPRFCRDVEGMEGEDLLEQVFLTKFRCLEMSSGFNGRMSGAQEGEEGDASVALSYLGANLYPYKLRLDTFYADGWRLPQTEMVYARGENVGVNIKNAKKLGERLLTAWGERPAGMNYATWLQTLGEVEVERLYMAGCTVMPTFEACNGYYVIGRNFENEGYWPGRAALGLHDIVGRRPDKAPEGTILDVLEPGYVTASTVHPAKVIVSDGTGYVSPNAVDPLPFFPNLNLPHSRTVSDWRATWLPTNPEHFESPALWGWDVDTGRFLQVSGPVWDPLHYYYESVDLVLRAFDESPVSEERPLVFVPEEMEERFYPIIAMKGFDTFSDTEYMRRYHGKLLPQSCLKRVPTEDYTIGIGYHPLPAEYEFELDPFWFPELHPLGRDHGLLPEELEDRIAPVANPKVTISMFKSTVDAPPHADWMADETMMATPMGDPLDNYPQLMRYLVADMEAEALMTLCPMPYLGEPSFNMKLPAMGWWMQEDGTQLDGPLALQEVVPNIYDALWDMRQEGADLLRFRHMVYRTNPLLYKLAWWYGWDVGQLQDIYEETRGQGSAIDWQEIASLQYT